jgi:hypothetical protein
MAEATFLLSHFHKQSWEQSPKKIRVALHSLADIMNQSMPFHKFPCKSKGDESIVTDESEVIDMQ